MDGINGAVPQQGMVAIVTGLKDAKLSVTLRDNRQSGDRGGQSYNTTSGVSSGVQTCNIPERSHSTTQVLRCEPYVSTYQQSYGTVRSVSPPASPTYGAGGSQMVDLNLLKQQLSELRASLHLGRRVSKKTEPCASSSAIYPPKLRKQMSEKTRLDHLRPEPNYMSGIDLDTGSPPSSPRQDLRISDAFADSLRRYPFSAERTSSADIIQRLLTYTQSKNSSKHYRTKRVQSLTRPVHENLSGNLKTSNKNTQTYTRTTNVSPTRDVSGVYGTPVRKRRLVSPPNSDLNDQSVYPETMSYDYMKIGSFSHPETDVRYLHDMSRYVKDTLREVCTNDNMVCPSMADRYNTHRRTHHQVEASTHTMGPDDEIAQTSGSKEHDRMIGSSDDMDLKECIEKPSKTLSGSICEKIMSIKEKLCEICRQPTPCRCDLPEPCSCPENQPVAIKDKIKSIDFFTELRRLYTQEPIYKSCTCPRDIDDHIDNTVEEWLKLLPVYSSNTIKDNSLRENMIHNLKNNLKQHFGNYTKIRNDVFECLKDLPMWLPPDKSDHDDFKEKVGSDLLKRIENIGDVFGTRVKKWLETLHFKSDVRVNKDDIATHLTNILHDTVMLAEDLENDLKDTVYKELVYLPISNSMTLMKGELTNKLVDSLLSLPPKVMDSLKHLDNFSSVRVKLSLLEKITRWVHALPFETTALIKRDSIVSELNEELIGILNTTEATTMRNTIKTGVENKIVNLPIQGGRKEIEIQVSRLVDDLLPDMVYAVALNWVESVALNQDSKLTPETIAYKLTQKLLPGCKHEDDAAAHMRTISKELNDLPISGSQTLKILHANKLANDLGELVSKDTYKLKEKIKDWIDGVPFQHEPAFNKRQVANELTKIVNFNIEKAKPTDIWYTIRQEIYEKLKTLPVDCYDNEIEMHIGNLYDQVIHLKFKEAVQKCIARVSFNLDSSLNDQLSTDIMVQKICDTFLYVDPNQVTDSIRDYLNNALAEEMPDPKEKLKFIDSLLEIIDELPKPRDKVSVIVKNWYEKEVASKIPSSTKDTAMNLIKKIKKTFLCTPPPELWNTVKLVILAEFEQTTFDLFPSEMKKLAEDLATRLAGDVYIETVKDWIRYIPFDQQSEEVTKKYAVDLANKLRNTLQNVEDEEFDFILENTISNELESLPILYDDEEKRIQTEKLLDALKNIHPKRNKILTYVENWMKTVPFKPESAVNKTRVTKNLAKNINNVLGTMKAKDAWNELKLVAKDELARLPVNGDSYKIEILAENLANFVQANIYEDAIQKLVKTIPFDAKQHIDKNEVMHKLTENIKIIIPIEHQGEDNTSTVDAIIESIDEFPVLYTKSQKIQLAEELLHVINELPKEQSKFSQTLLDWAKDVPFEDRSIDKKQFALDLKYKLRNILSSTPPNSAWVSMKDDILETLNNSNLKFDVTKHEELAEMLANELVANLFSDTIRKWTKIIPFNNTLLVDKHELNFVLTNKLKTKFTSDCLDIDSLTRAVCDELVNLPIHCNSHDKNSYVKELAKILIDNLMKLPQEQPKVTNRQKTTSLIYGTEDSEYSKAGNLLLSTEKNEEIIKQVLGELKMLKLEGSDEASIQKNIRFKVKDSINNLLKGKEVDPMYKKNLEMSLYEQLFNMYELETRRKQQLVAEFINNIREWLAENAELSTYKNKDKRFSRELAEKFSEETTRAETSTHIKNKIIEEIHHTINVINPVLNLDLKNALTEKLLKKLDIDKYLIIDDKEKANKTKDIYRVGCFKRLEQPLTLFDLDNTDNAEKEITYVHGVLNKHKKIANNPTSTYETLTSPSESFTRVRKWSENILEKISEISVIDKQNNEHQESKSDHSSKAVEQQSENKTDNSKHTLTNQFYTNKQYFKISKSASNTTSVKSATNTNSLQGKNTPNIKKVIFIAPLVKNDSNIDITTESILNDASLLKLNDSAVLDSTSRTKVTKESKTVRFFDQNYIQNSENNTGNESKPEEIVNEVNAKHSINKIILKRDDNDPKLQNETNINVEVGLSDTNLTTKNDLQISTNSEAKTSFDIAPQKRNLDDKIPPEFKKEESKRVCRYPKLKLGSEEEKKDNKKELSHAQNNTDDENIEKNQEKRHLFASINNSGQVLNEWAKCILQDNLLEDAVNTSSVNKSNNVFRVPYNVDENQVNNTNEILTSKQIASLKDKVTPKIHQTQSFYDSIRDKNDKVMELKANKYKRDFTNKLSSLLRLSYDKSPCAEEQISKNLEVTFKSIVTNWIEQFPELKSKTTLEERENRKLVRDLLKIFLDIKETHSLDKKKQLEAEIKGMIDDTLEYRGKEVQNQIRNKLTEKLLLNIEYAEQRIRSITNQGYKETLCQTSEHNVDKDITEKTINSLITTSIDDISNDISAQVPITQTLPCIKDDMAEIPEVIQEIHDKKLNENTKELTDKSKLSLASVYLQINLPEENRSIEHNETYKKETLVFQKEVLKWLEDIPETASSNPAQRKANEKTSETVARELLIIFSSTSDSDKIKRVLFRDIKEHLENVLEKRRKRMTSIEKNRLSNKLANVIVRSASMGSKLLDSQEGIIWEWISSIPLLAHDITPEKRETVSNLHKALKKTQKKSISDDIKKVEMKKDIDWWLKETMRDKSLDCNTKDKLIAKLVEGIQLSTNVLEPRAETSKGFGIYKQPTRNKVSICHYSKRASKLFLRRKSGDPTDEMENSNGTKELSKEIDAKTQDKVFGIITQNIDSIDIPKDKELIKKQIIDILQNDTQLPEAEAEELTKSILKNAIEQIHDTQSHDDEIVALLRKDIRSIIEEYPIDENNKNNIEEYLVGKASKRLLDDKSEEGTEEEKLNILKEKTGLTTKDASSLLNKLDSNYESLRLKLEGPKKKRIATSDHFNIGSKIEHILNNFFETHVTNSTPAKKETIQGVVKETVSNITDILYGNEKDVKDNTDPLRTELHKQLRKVSLDSEESITNLAEEVLQQILNAHLEAKMPSKILRKNTAYPNTITKYTDSNGNLNEKKRISQVNRYTNELENAIGEWLDNLPINQDNFKDNQFKGVIIEELSGNIVGRNKYLQLNPSMKTSDADEYDNLVDMCQKWMKDFLDDDDLKTAFTHKDSLIEAIIHISTPRLISETTALQNEIMTWQESLLPGIKSTVDEELAEEYAEELAKTILRYKNEPDTEVKIRSEIAKSLRELYADLENDSLQRLESSLYNILKEKGFTDGKKSLTEDLNDLMNNNLTEALLNWLKQSPMYQKASSSNIKKMEEGCVDLGKGIKNTLSAAQSGTDTENLVRNEIVKYLPNIVTDSDSRDDEDFMTSTADNILLYLKGQQAFTDLTNRNATEVDLLANAVDDWVSKQAIDTKTLQDKTRLEEATKRLTTRLRQARNQFPPTVPQHEQAIRDEARKFLRSNITDLRKKSDERYIEEEVTKLVKLLQVVPIEPIDTKNFIKPYKSPSDTLYEYIEEWTNNLPIQGEEERVNWIKQNLANKLVNKIGELNMNSDIFKDQDLYQDLLQDEVDQLLAQVPGNPEINKYLPALKKDLISKIMDARRRMLEELAGTFYKQLLRDKISTTIPLPNTLTADDQAALELLKDKVADIFIRLRFSSTNGRENCTYKKKVSNEINFFYNDVVRRYPCARVDLDKLKIDVHCALQNVPVPRDDCMKSEVEQVRIRDLLNDWMKDVPLRQETTQEILHRFKLAAILAKRIHYIEMEKQHNGFIDSELKITEEITRFINKLHIVEDQETIIPELVQKLVDKINRSESFRKFISSGQYQANEVRKEAICSKYPCTLNQEDQDHLRRIRERRRECNDTVFCPSTDSCSQTYEFFSKRESPRAKFVEKRDMSCMTSDTNPCHITPRVVVKEYIWDGPETSNPMYIRRSSMQGIQTSNILREPLERRTSNSYCDPFHTEQQTSSYDFCPKSPYVDHQINPYEPGAQTRYYSPDMSFSEPHEQVKPSTDYTTKYPFCDGQTSPTCGWSPFEEKEMPFNSCRPYNLGDDMSSEEDYPIAESTRYYRRPSPCCIDTRNKPSNGTRRFLRDDRRGNLRENEDSWYPFRNQRGGRKPDFSFKLDKTKDSGKCNCKERFLICKGIGKGYVDMCQSCGSTCPHPRTTRTLNFRRN